MRKIIMCLVVMGMGLPSANAQWKGFPLTNNTYRNWSQIATNAGPMSQIWSGIVERANIVQSGYAVNFTDTWYITYGTVQSTKTVVATNWGVISTNTYTNTYALYTNVITTNLFGTYQYVIGSYTGTVAPYWFNMSSPFLAGTNSFLEVMQNNIYSFMQEPSVSAGNDVVNTNLLVGGTFDTYFGIVSNASFPVRDYKWCFAKEIGMLPNWTNTPSGGVDTPTPDPMWTHLRFTNGYAVYLSEYVAGGWTQKPLVTSILFTTDPDPAAGQSFYCPDMTNMNPVARIVSQTNATADITFSGYRYAQTNIVPYQKYLAIDGLTASLTTNWTALTSPVVRLTNITVTASSGVQTGDYVILSWTNFLQFYVESWRWNYDSDMYSWYQYWPVLAHFDEFQKVVDGVRCIPGTAIGWTNCNITIWKYTNEDDYASGAATETHTGVELPYATSQAGTISLLESYYHHDAGSTQYLGVAVSGYAVYDMPTNIPCQIKGYLLCKTIWNEYDVQGQSGYYTNYYHHLAAADSAVTTTGVRAISQKIGADTKPNTATHSSGYYADIILYGDYSESLTWK